MARRKPASRNPGFLVRSDTLPTLEERRAARVSERAALRVLKHGPGIMTRAGHRDRHKMLVYLVSLPFDKLTAVYRAAVSQFETNT